jgi:hypothetical protein
MPPLSIQASALLSDPATHKVVVAGGEESRARAELRPSLRLLEDGTLAYAEPFEASEANSLMLALHWEGKTAEILLSAPDGRAWRITAAPRRYLYTGPLFQSFYREARAQLGPNSQVGGVWVLAPLKEEDAGHEARKRKEDEARPHYRYLDRSDVTPNGARA